MRPRSAFCAVVCAAFVLACQTELATVDYKLYPGPPRAPDELARIAFGPLPLLAVDGLRASKADWRSIEVAPGRHFVVWDLTAEVSARPGPQAPVQRRPGQWVELEAGHAYTWHLKVDPERIPSDFLWLQDDATGRVLAGERP